MSTEKTLITTTAGLGSIGGIWAAVHTAAPEGICYSAGSLAITTILLALVVSAILGLFSLLLAELKRQNQDLRDLLYRNTDMTEKAVSVVEKSG